MLVACVFVSADPLTTPSSRTRVSINMNARFEVDISKLDKELYNKSIIFMTCFDRFEYDESKHQIKECSNIEEVIKSLADKQQITPFWISFSVGYEFLFKAILTKYEALSFRKTRASTRINNFKPCSNIESIKRVYSFVADSYIVAPKNPYIQNELKNTEIDHLYDFSIGTLGRSLENLQILEDKKIISADERAFLDNASHTLLDIRRNIDVHTFLLLNIAGSLNGDLKDVYIPAINLMLDIYHRK